jgi:hypothetical protein
MRIKNAASLHGITIEDVDVIRGGSLYVFGRLEGNVMIRDHATVTIFGTVTGNVLVEPTASVHVFGEVEGMIAGTGAIRLPETYSSGRAQIT